METIVWSDRYLIGIELIDRQHKQLFDVIGRLTELPSDQTESDHVERTLLDMLAYAMYHLRDEEALMARYDYPHLDAHKRLHHSFIVSLRNFIDKHSAQTRDSLHGYLSLWIRTHILDEDMQIRAFLVEKGVIQ